ncbi:hypothetical protein KIS1582_3072 [Cytobacillus firmus]|uniref:Uncharacterized protein n=1 Tax=Cytobacillus firmus TaxID=1399 RepID=A0A800MVF3_CYTFI|nr:hypothetical protein KIS1582_3072 [Cytobacillus firmus]
MFIVYFSPYDTAKFHPVFIVKQIDNKILYLRKTSANLPICEGL